MQILKKAPDRPSISALVLAKNEELMLANCLETLSWCDEIVLLDNGSTDNTKDLAKKLGARVFSSSSDDFSLLRNTLLEKAKMDWVIYIDPDERITPELAQEISVHLEAQDTEVMQFQRKNIFYAKEMKHGGWQNDLLTRIFKKEALNEWMGEIHESPVYEGKTIQLHHPLIHLSHRNTRDGLLKSSQWTKKEAELLVRDGISKVTISTLFRKAIMEFLRRAYFKKGYKDGFVGLLEAMIQAMNRFLVYVQVWELQQKPDLSEQYQKRELQIIQSWKNLK